MNFQVVVVLLLQLSCLASTSHKADNRTCTAGRFRCADASCVPSNWVCDGQLDCPLGEDERACLQSTCKGTAVKCVSGECIPSKWMCDGEADCTDLSDESNRTCGNSSATICRPGYKQCLNTSGCVSTDWWCDGDTDCEDGSDETNCESTLKCAAENFECMDGQCIPLTWLCDGTNDCDDGSDEKLNCSSCSDRRDFSCGAGHCVPTHWRCDGERDCDSGQDENKCDIVLPGNPGSSPNKTCDARGFTCASGECLPASKVCDGTSDCRDSSDEGGKCGSKNCLKPSSHCSQVCYQSPLGPTCQCHQGWILGSDRVTCSDVNECEQHINTCCQHCKNTPGSFHCSCADGYRLGADGFTCKAEGRKPLIIFIVEGKLHMRTLKTTGKVTSDAFLGHVGRAGGLALDIHKGRVYYADMQTSAIHSVAFAGNDYRDYKIISDISLVEGLDVDWIDGKLYWTDVERNTIETAYLNGSSRRTLVSRDLDKPRGITVDPLKRILFWTDWGKVPKIEKVRTDGTERMVLVDTHIFWPNGIALDLPSQRIYWTDAKRSTIESCSYNGSQRALYSVGKSSHPYGLAVFEDRVYWTDWIARTVESADKYSGFRREVLVKGRHRPMRVLIAHPALQPQNVSDLQIQSRSVKLTQPVNVTRGVSTGRTTRGQQNSSGVITITTSESSVFVTVTTQRESAIKTEHVNPTSSNISGHVFSPTRKSSRTNLNWLFKRKSKIIRNRTRKRPLTQPRSRTKTSSSRAVFKEESSSEDDKHSNASIHRANETHPEGEEEEGRECASSPCHGTSKCPVHDKKCRLLETHERAVVNYYDDEHLELLPSLMTGAIFIVSLLLLLLLKRKLHRPPSRRLGPTRRLYMTYFNMPEIDNLGATACQLDCSPSLAGYSNPMYNITVSDMSEAREESEDPDVLEMIVLEGVENIVTASPYAEICTYKEQ